MAQQVDDKAWLARRVGLQGARGKGLNGPARFAGAGRGRGGGADHEKRHASLPGGQKELAARRER